MSHNSCVTRK